MKHALSIPSPIQRVAYQPFERAKIEVLIKRDDLIHPAISGNKWRKLKYNIQEIEAAQKVGFVTFGGAFSNHIAASAYAGCLAGLKMLGVIRGEISDTQNKTLQFAKRCGMQLLSVSRQQYANKENPAFLIDLQAQFPDYQIIPEGGCNIQGVRGCIEILQEAHEPYDVVAVPLGSATTFTGLLCSGFSAREFLGFPAVKGGGYLASNVYNLFSATHNAGFVPCNLPQPQWRLITDYHFGGFAKVDAQLIVFINRFYRETGIPLDPIYTSKMMYGLVDMANNNAFEPGTRVLAIHTGGLQGVVAMNKKLKNKNLYIEYEEAVLDNHVFPDCHSGAK